MRRFGLVVLAFLVLSTVACASFVEPSLVFHESTQKEDEALIPVTAPEMFDGCAGPEIEPIHPEFEQAVVELTNEVRAEHGLPPLKRAEGLDLSARYHTADMSVNNFFNHNTIHIIDEQPVEICNTWTRIEKYYTGWTALAENIAAGQRVPEMAINGWMNSPDHRHNMLSDTYWEIGVGFYEGEGEYRYYWGQNFGKRAGVYPLIINGEKAVTDETTVDVYIYGDWQQMRLRDNQGNWSDWMPFERSFQWKLANVRGTHTVTAELQGRDGSATAMDTIQLEEVEE